jgi:hypothetical protein
MKGLDMQTKLKIARFSPLSLAKVLSIYYIFWSFVFSLVNVSTDKESWYALLGF